LDDSGILQAALGRIVRAFGARKYALLWVLTFFFMAMGAFFGLFDEVVPLVPLMVALSYSLGWDLLVGLGMSIWPPTWASARPFEPLQHWRGPKAGRAAPVFGCALPPALLPGRVCAGGCVSDALRTPH
jgi:hypothetical protein